MVSTRIGSCVALRMRREFPAHAVRRDMDWTRHLLRTADCISQDANSIDSTLVRPSILFAPHSIQSVMRSARRAESKSRGTESAGNSMA